jgi:hypothetical protein
MLQPTVDLDVPLQLPGQRVVHQAVDRSPVRVTQLIGYLLMGRSAGGQLDRTRPPGDGQGTVAVLAVTCGRRRSGPRAM